MKNGIKYNNIGHGRNGCGGDKPQPLNKKRDIARHKRYLSVTQPGDGCSKIEGA
jgi:hypothetical protein